MPLRLVDWKSCWISNGHLLLLGPCPLINTPHFKMALPLSQALIKIVKTEMEGSVLYTGGGGGKYHLLDWIKFRDEISINCGFRKICLLFVLHFCKVSVFCKIMFRWHDCPIKGNIFSAQFANDIRWMHNSVERGIQSVWPDGQLLCSKFDHLLIKYGPKEEKWPN